MDNKKWPPIDPGTRVVTTQPNLEKREEWTQEGWMSKKWGVLGRIITHHDSHGLCYDVRHEDGTEGCYDPSELKVDPLGPIQLPEGDGIFDPTGAEDLTTPHHKPNDCP